MKGRVERRENFNFEDKSESFPKIRIYSRVSMKGKHESVVPLQSYVYRTVRDEQF